MWRLKDGGWLVLARWVLVMLDVLLFAWMVVRILGA